MWRSLGAGAGLLLPVGCDSDPMGTDAGAMTPDAGPPVMTDAGPSPADFRGVTKGPWVQLLSPGRARLRFETRIDEPVPVRIERAGGTDEPSADRSVAVIDYERDALMMEDRLPDYPGQHVLHDVVFEGLEPGEALSWTVTPEVGDAISGSFTAPVAPDAGFTFGWIADTSVPFCDPSIAALESAEPHLVLHGGDITYQANPYDTWNGLTRSFGPLFRRAPVHFTLGNHESDAEHEIDQMFDRLMGDQGDEGGSARFFAYTYGGVRFIHLDTETGSIVDDDDGQLAWLDAELDAQRGDPDILYPIVVFHRPTYTFSKHAPGNLATRMALHERFLEYGVPLVFAGHAHCYERFLVDGVHYVTDGSGGAALYDPNEDRDEVAAMRPDEIALRQAVFREHGCTATEVAPDGGLTVTRYAADDASVQDMVVIAAPA